MSELTSFEQDYVFSTIIEIGDKGDSITLREPTAIEMRQFKPISKELPEQERLAAGVENVKVMTALFPACLVDHTFTLSQGGKAKNAAVAQMIIKSGTQFDAILTKWMESLPFGKPSEQKSDSSPE